MALVISACGGSGSSSSPAAAQHPATKAATGAVVLASARTTAAAGSARIALSVGGGSQAASFSLTADGVADFKTGDSQLTMHFGGGMAGIISGDLEVRSVAKVVYVQLPASLRGVLGRFTGGKPWLKLDLSKAKGGGSVVPGIGESDPSQFLAYLQTVSDDVTKVGTEKVRGVDTTHYHATFDLAKAVKQRGMSTSVRDALAKIRASHGTTLPKIPADIFLDSDGRLRRMTMQLDLSSFMGVGGGSGRVGSVPTVTTSLDMYDFGVPVNVVAPPAADVATLPNFGMNGGGGFGPGKRVANPASAVQ
jgi:hypothetical protein